MVKPPGHIIPSLNCSKDINNNTLNLLNSILILFTVSMVGSDNS